MQVTIGTEWASYEGTRRSYAVTLSEDDINTEGMNKAQIFNKLNVSAELMMISHAVKEGGMSTVQAEQRRRELLNL